MKDMMIAVFIFSTSATVAPQIIMLDSLCLINLNIFCSSWKYECEMYVYIYIFDIGSLGKCLLGHQL